MSAKARRVTIPASDMHEGIYTIDVVLDWVCPVCGAERGVPAMVASYDGSRRLHCDGWINSCGHVDTYADVRREASANGLNCRLATADIRMK